MNGGCKGGCGKKGEPIKITGEALVLADGTCQLRLYVDGVACLPIDVTGLFDKIEFPEQSLSTVVDNGDGTATVKQSDGTACLVIKAGKVSTVTNNANGTGTVQQNDGTTCIFVKGAQSTVVDNDNGTGTVQQNDGSICVFVKGTQSLVIDNGDGTATITQNDGSQKTNLVCGQQSTVVDNGDNTGTVTQNDGSSCTFLKSVDIPADVRVTEINVVESADGSEHSVELVLSNGTTLDGGPIIDQWSQVTDNGDGSGSVADPAGNTCTFAKGTASTVTSNEDGTSTIAQNDGTTHKVIDDPIVTEECVNGQKIITYCSGLQVCETWQYIEMNPVFVSDTSTPVIDGDGGLTVGDQIPGTQRSITVPDWPHPQGIRLESIHTKVAQSNFEGNVATKPRYRVNGGAWVEFDDGGSDVLEILGVGKEGENARIGEFEFKNSTDAVVPGGATIDFDMKLHNVLPGTSGLWDLNRMDFKVGYWSCSRVEL